MPLVAVVYLANTGMTTLCCCSASCSGAIVSSHSLLEGSRNRSGTLYSHVRTSGLAGMHTSSPPAYGLSGHGNLLLALALVSVDTLTGVGPQF